MKTKFIVIGLAAAIRVQADTNFFEFIRCDADIYTNATISQVTPAYATVTYAGGVVQVPLCDLPVNLQQQYHYNSNAAAQFRSEQNEKSRQLRAAAAARQAAYEKATAALIAQSKNIQVSSIIDETSDGGLPLCAVGYGGGGGDGDRPIPSRILLENLPAEVRNFFGSYQILKADIAALEAQPVSATANSTIYNPDGSVDLLGSQLASQNAASYALHQAKENKQDTLDRMNRQLNELEISRFDHTTIRAYFSGRTYGPYEI
jgi:hypothetical protein